jgi:hypothetical protein
LRKDLILEHTQQLERKKHAEKKGKQRVRGKTTCEEANMPKHDRVGVFDKDCNTYKLVK